MRLRLLPFVAGALLLAARPLAAQQAATATAPTPVRLVIGISATSQDGYFANDGGFFKKQGLDVTLTQARGGAVEAAAVAGNAADIGDGNMITFANAHLHGVPFVAIAAGYSYDARDPYVVLAVLPASTVRVAKDLDGATIGEPSLGGMAEVAIGDWMAQTGGDLKSVKYVEIPPSESLAALQQGRVAAVVFQDPQLAEDGDKVRALRGPYEIVAKRYLNTVWYTTADYAAKNPDVIRRFQLALNEGAAWAAQHPDLARASLTKWLKITVTKLRFSHSDALDAAQLQPFLDAATQYGLLARKLNAAELMIGPAK